MTMKLPPRERSARETRAHFADTINDAIQGRITYVTSHGRRIAAIVPLTEVRDPDPEPGNTEGPVTP